MTVIASMVSGLLTSVGLARPNSNHPSTKSSTSKPTRSSFCSDPLREDLVRTNTNILADLPLIKDYPGTLADTRHVIQGEARFLTPDAGNTVGGLYTTSACSCFILVGVAKDIHGTVENLSLAHIDRATTLNGLHELYARTKMNSARLELLAIGGTQDNALKVLRSMREFGADISFFSADLTGETVHGAIVDARGIVYCGGLLDFFRSPFNFPVSLESVERNRFTSGVYYGLIFRD